MHFARHHEGCEKFVHTQRGDRRKLDVPRDELPQGSLNDMDMVANAQALINISSAFGFPPVNMFKFEIDGCEYTLYDSLKILSNTFLDVLDKATSNTSSRLNSVNLQGLYLDNVKLYSDYYLNLKKGFNFNLI